MPLIRKPAASALPSSTPPALGVDALTRGSDDERWSAARAAADHPEQAQALGDAVARERNPRVREAMFTGLCRIGTAESVEALLPLMRCNDSALRTGALDALRSMPTVIAPYAAQLIHDPDSDVRLLACELVRVLPGEEASALLCALIDSEREANVCASAVEVLADVGGPEALSALERCEERFRATPFLVFSIRTIAARIRAQPPVQRE